MGGGEAPTNSITFSCNIEFPQIGIQAKDEVFAMASLKAPIINEQDKRAPIDMICVIDRSGSMAGSKLDLTKAALEFVVSQLDDQDTLSLVTYDTTVSTDLEPTKMNKENKQVATRSIKSITAGSMTNLSGGLLAGLKLAENRLVPNKICSVLLFTDGLANVGITQVNALTSATESKIALCKEGTSVFTFGFGGDHDANMLRSISNSGKGMYYFIETVDHIPLSFADCLGGLQSVVAQNLRLTIESTNGATIKRNLTTTYKTSGTLPGSSCSVSLGDLYSEEERDILFSFHLPATSAPTDTFAFATLTLEYFNILTSRDERVQAIGTVSRTQNPPTNQARDVRVDMQLNRLAAASALEESRRLADEGRLEDARKRLQEAKLENIASASSATEYSKGLALDMDLAFESMQTESQYKVKGKQMMMAKAQSHQNQRSNEASMDAPGAYSNHAKKSKKAAFFG